MEDFPRRQTANPGLSEAEFLSLSGLLAAVQSLSDGLFTVDRHNKITFMNSAAEMLTGWSAQDALGKPSGIVFRVVDGATGEASWQPIAPAIREDRPYTLLPNTVLIRKDMTEVHIEDTATESPDRSRGFRDTGELWQTRWHSPRFAVLNRLSPSAIQ